MSEKKTSQRSDAAKSYWYRILDGSWETDGTGRWINVFMVVLIALNLVTVVLESVADIGQRHAVLFQRFELFSVAVFTIEYGMRLWACTADPRGLFEKPFAGRLRYAVTPMAIVDLLAILPFFLQHFTGLDLRFLRVFRLLRVLKLTRYFPAMQMIGNVVVAQRRTLLSAMFVMVTLLVLASSLMYLIERHAQPDVFGSIPAAMWWGMATLTTVGYGDVVPVTAAGKLVGTCIALFGIAMFALPAAILTSGFTQEIRKRDFLTSWNLVASLPPFATLKAAEIAEIAQLLRDRYAMPGEVIFKTGDVADAVYFITAGTVKISHDQNALSLDYGEFFGELSLLHKRRRAADAVAHTSCRLLVLDAEDFHDLCRDNPQLREHIEMVATHRVDQLDLGNR